MYNFLKLGVETLGSFCEADFTSHNVMRSHRASFGAAVKTWDERMKTFHYATINGYNLYGDEGAQSEVELEFENLCKSKPKAQKKNKEKEMDILGIGSEATLQDDEILNDKIILGSKPSCFKEIFIEAFTKDSTGKKRIPSQSLGPFRTKQFKMEASKEKLLIFHNLIYYL